MMKIAVTLYDVCFSTDWKSSGLPSGVEADSIGKIIQFKQTN